MSNTTTKFLRKRKNSKNKYYNDPSTNKIFTMPSREELHKQYAGAITECDFNGYNSLKDEMEHVISAYRFNKSLRYKGNTKATHTKNGWRFNY